MDAQQIGKFIPLLTFPIRASLAGAIVVQFATKWISNFKPTFKIAYKTTFLGYLSSEVIIFLYFYSIIKSGLGVDALSIMFSVIIPIVFFATFYGVMIKDHEAIPIGFAKGIIVSLLHAVILLVLIFVIMPSFAGLFVVG